jgi:hypothetical protein
MHVYLIVDFFRRDNKSARSESQRSSTQETDTNTELLDENEIDDVPALKPPHYKDDGSKISDYYFEPHNQKEPWESSDECIFDSKGKRTWLKAPVTTVFKAISFKALLIDEKLRPLLG